MSHVDTPWTRLASRTARGLLVRKGVSYEQLVSLLSVEGVEESPRGLEGKVQRGSYRCSFFLQLLHAVRADIPLSLCIPKNNESWEDVSRRIFLQELTAHGLTFEELTKRLHALGLDFNPSVLERNVSIGNYPFTLLLQLSAVAPVSLLERFVDQTDIEKVAAEAF
ncbi:DUF6471 domain-containing protein [Cupriavidus basilensis]